MKVTYVNGVPQGVTITLGDVKFLLAKAIIGALAEGGDKVEIDVGEIDISYDHERFDNGSGYGEDVVFEIDFKKTPATQHTTVVEIDL